MPISSFHGLRKNSVSTKPWNSTRSSPLRNSPRESPTRKRSSVGVPRLWENDFPSVYDEERNDAKYIQTRHSPVVTCTPKDYGNGTDASRKSSLSFRTRNVRQERGLKRRDTFPKLNGENNSTRTTKQALRRSKTDPSIVPEHGTRKVSNKPPKRPTCLWRTTSKKELAKSPTKSRRRKINNALSPPSFYSADGSLDDSLSRKQPSQGDKVVCILNKKPQLGILKYVGTTHFADGEWCGIVLEQACGKNDGSVRGVRYFRCRNKHGIFVHSHKVRRADETTLSEFNLLEGFYSPEPSEKQDKTVLDSDSTMASGDVKLVTRDVYEHRDLKSLKLTRRNRSISLDRYLFIKTKQLAKGLNILIHNSGKDDKADTWKENRINRSVSLPKISKEQVFSGPYLTSEIAPLDRKPLREKGEFCYTGALDPENTNTAEVLCFDNLPSEDSLDESNKCHAHSNGQTVVQKVGHAVSLDTHFMIEKGQLTVMANGTKEESHITNKEDPFIQGRHCSCPSLHCADHFSESITTCLDLGRTERAVIHEASGENDADLETAHVKYVSYNQEMHSHSQSEALEKIFQKTKVVRSKSSSSKDAELGRKGSWPWETSTPKRPLRSYGSIDDIDFTGTVGSEDVFEKGFTSILAQVKLISGDMAQRCDIIPVNKGIKQGTTVEPDGQAVDLDSNYAESFSGSQGSLSSTGTNGSRGKNMSSKKGISSSAKHSFSKPKAIPSSGRSVVKATQKQSRLEQLRQQQQNHQGQLPSSVNKSTLAKKTGTNSKNTSDAKVTKRHTLAAVTDVKSFVPRPMIKKRPMSEGMTEIPVNVSKEEAKSKLPVKRLSTPSQISRPAATPKVEKTSDKPASVQRCNSSGTGRPSVPIVKRNSSMAQADARTRKPTTVSKNKEPINVGQSRKLGGQTPASAKGSKGMMVIGPKPQTSRVTRSSSSAKAKAPPVKEAKVLPKPLSVSTKKAVQPVKQNAKQAPSMYKQGSSKLPRKVSAQLSNASDSASVTSSVKDQDNLEDLHDSEIDAVSVSTEVSDRDRGVTSHGHFQQDEIDAKVISPIEAPCRVMPPDILSETPYLSKQSSKQSIGVQVEDDSDLKTIQGLNEKTWHLHELVKQRTGLCWQLQDQIDEDSSDFVAASVVILSVAHKLQWSQKHNNQLQRKLMSTLQEMNVIQEKLAEEEANSVKLQEEMMYQSSEHAVAIETLKADYENLLERTSTDLKIKHQGEITLAIETHKAQVHEMHQQHEKELSQLKKSHEQQMASLKEEHRDEIVDLESKHSGAIDELIEEHHVEIETIKADYDEQQADIKEKNDKMVSECTSLNKKLEQLQDQNQKDIETRIQEAIKKYESLPAELESIKAVLEMKKEEIKQLRKEKMKKHLELEQLEDIKVQTQKLQQENESLTFVVETKSRFERQLSVERDSLRDSLERESAKSKRLSLENEELQWRLVNSTSPPGTPTGEARPLSGTSNRNSFRLSASFPDTGTIDE